LYHKITSLDTKEMKPQAQNTVQTNKEIPFRVLRNNVPNKVKGTEQVSYTEQAEEILKQKNDSLAYARSLQDAMIPGKENLVKVFPESFVFHSPKEIISGDFCWLEQVGDIIYVAAGDCTGHGVPGALMTIVCANSLTRAVKEFNLAKPGEILDKVRDMVIHSFSSSTADIKDGMDISIVAINRKTLTVEWSGANNSLLYFHNNTLNELNGDKQPVGKYERYNCFTTRSMQLNKGDILYLFTDGYADQFGGERGKKLMYKYFKQLLAELAPMEIDIQNNCLYRQFESWKGDLEQVDDVLLMGIKL
jgi:serine phosphatase RsbU (regulator of sigma subunit)